MTNAMRLAHHLAEPFIAAPAVLAIGSFDGVHRGHQALLQTARDLARTQGLACYAVTFEPHPRQFFTPDQNPFRLTPWPLKRLLLEIYADRALALDFDAELAALPAAAFATALIDQFQARHIVVGPDFAFGQGRKGDASLLQALLGSENVTIVDLAVTEKGKISSSAIRERIIKSDFEGAKELLGHTYLVSGALKGGNKLETSYFLLPDPSIYPGFIYKADKWVEISLKTTKNQLIELDCMQQGQPGPALVAFGTEPPAALPFDPAGLAG